MKQFNTGDWVRLKNLFFGNYNNEVGKIHRIMPNDYCIVLCNGRFAKDIRKDFGIPTKNIELWEPKPNEPVWLYNDDETLEDLVLARFFNKVGNYHYGFTLNGQELSGYLYCQPFIGTLPTLNKGQKNERNNNFRFNYDSDI